MLPPNPNKPLHFRSASTIAYAFAEDGLHDRGGRLSQGLRFLFGCDDGGAGDEEFRGVVVE